MADKTKSMCMGCHKDYYNHNAEGGCWCFAGAKLVTRTKVGYWQEPPYNWAPKQTLSCHIQDGCSWIEEDDPRIKVAAIPE